MSRHCECKFRTTLYVSDDGTTNPHFNIFNRQHFKLLGERMVVRFEISYAFQKLQKIERQNRASSERSQDHKTKSCELICPFTG